MFGDYDKFYQNVFANGFNSATGLVDAVGYNNRNDRKNLFSQTDLVWENRLAGIDQTLLFGFELGRETVPQFSHYRRASPTATLFRSRSDSRFRTPIFAPIASDANNRVKATVAAALCPGPDPPRRLARDRRRACASTASSSTSMTCAPSAAARSAARDNLWSPRLGLVLKPTDDLSFYASYSRSYLPQSGDQFSGLTDVTDGLKPERFDNYEVGAKWEVLDGLLATAAIYQLDRTNTRATDPNDPSRTVLTGAQRSRGLELGLERSVTSRWLISAGYTLQKAEISRTTSAAPKGREVPLVPRHSFSLWNRYDLTRQHRRRPRPDRALEILCDDQQCGEAARLCPRRCGAVLQAAGRASRRSSMSRMCSAPIISRPRTATIISRRARRARSRRRSATASSAPSSSARLRISFRSRTNSARASRRPSWSGMRSKEAGVDRHPAFAAVGERQRLAAHLGDGHRPCRPASAPRLPRARP